MSDMNEGCNVLRSNVNLWRESATSLSSQAANMLTEVEDDLFNGDRVKQASALSGEASYFHALAEKGEDEYVRECLQGRGAELKRELTRLVKAKNTLFAASLSFLSKAGDALAAGSVADFRGRMTQRSVMLTLSDFFSALQRAESKDLKMIAARPR